MGSSFPGNQPDMISSDDTNSESIESWLAGKLDEGENRRVEEWIGRHPELVQVVEEIPVAAAGQRLGIRKDPTLIRLMADLKGDAVFELDRSWEAVFQPVEDPALLGRLGGYEILEPIAEGGMGVVFLARDPELERLVAVKMLSPELAEVGPARKRFLREAKAAAALEHENILPVYGVHDEGVPYIAMRYAEGGTLQDRMDSGHVFTREELFTIARGVSLALAAAHEKGIIHRDIKPANILFSRDGDQIWVCDFGIARSSEDPDLTFAGSIAGTPKYMAPEQAAGGEIDSRSDLFSLGSVLYRCATGRPVYDGETTTEVLSSASGHDNVSLRYEGSASSGLPRWFRDLIHALLERDPSRRPVSASAVADAVVKEEFFPGPRRLSWRDPVLRRAAGAVALVLAGLFLMFSSPGTRAINQALAAWNGSPAFSIEGRLGIHANLADAITAAHDGEKILCPVGLVPLEMNLEIPPGKSIGIVCADPGGRSELVFPEMDRPMIRSGKSLDLRRIDLRWSASQEGADLAAIETADGGVVSMEQCELFAPLGTAVRWKGNPGTVLWNGCRIEAARMVDWEAGEDSESGKRFRILCRNSRFYGDLFFAGPPSADLPRILIEATGNYFAFGKQFVTLGISDPEEVAERVRWSGAENHFRNGIDHLAFDGVARYGQIKPAALPVTALAESVEPGRVTIVGSDEVYGRLRDALEDAPDGATLQISGRLPVHGMIYRKNEKPLVIEAAPGSAPVVIATDLIEHALFFHGPVRISGIQFERFRPVRRSLPVVGSRAPGETIEIEDCIFGAEHPGSLNGPSGFGFGFGRAGEVKISRCAFLGGQTIMARYNPDDRSGEGRLILRDCLFSGYAMISVDQFDAVHRLGIDAEGCLIHTRHLVTPGGGTRIVPLVLSLRSNLIGLEQSVFPFPRIAASEILTECQWIGEGNVIDEEATLFAGDSSVGLESGKLPPGYAFSEISPVWTAVFDRSVLPNAPTVDDLAEALGEGLRDHPAAATLEQFRSKKLEKP